MLIDFLLANQKTYFIDYFKYSKFKKNYFINQIYLINFNQIKAKLFTTNYHYFFMNFNFYNKA